MFNSLMRHSQLKPELRLAQAVSLFEADLSSEQKATLRTYRSQNEAASPNPGDVMYLTAEIDRRARESRNSSLCYGPRMTNFLSAIQQFASIGDVMIGGSQNIIACSVWFLVRVSLLSIVKSSSYLEKISELLMIAGRSAPRYQDIASLYPRSKNLQSHLAEYFIVVIELCHAQFNFIRKSALGQFTSSLSDADLKGFQSKLDLWANCIKEEMGVLVAETVEGEARRNTQFRALLRKDAKSTAYEQKTKTRLRVLDICSTYDYETPWKQARKVGNASLFDRETDYQDWKIQANSCTLLCTGKIGSGKSVLLANIVDDLNIHAHSRGVATTYFFCRSDIPVSLQAQTVIWSLVRQLLLFIPDLTKVAKVIEESAFATDFEHLPALLKTALPPTFKAFFVLDGLDECCIDEQQTLMRQLQQLQGMFTLLICTSFRLGSGDTFGSSLEVFIAPRRLSMPDDNPDIENFIERELETCIESGKLEIGDPTLILEIEDALLQKSQGMFLWVALQIKSLCMMKTDKAIRQALKNLPKDLSETFARILAKPEGLDKQYQMRILEIVTIVERPLRTEELREALSVIPGNNTYDRSTLLNNVEKTLACCGSLVIIDEEELTVRFVHHSVRQYVLATPASDKSFTEFTLSAHKTIADIIVTYLSYGVFETRLSTMVVPQIHTKSVPLTIVQSTLETSSRRQSLAIRLLKSKRGPNYDIGQIIEEERNRFNRTSVDDFPFYPYAKSFWQHHLLCARERKHDTTDAQWYQSLENLDLTTIDASISDQYNPIILSQAVNKGNEAVFRLLVETGKVDAEFKSNDGDDLLSYLLKFDHDTVVSYLLDTGRVDVDWKNDQGQTLLTHAIIRKCKSIINMLLETGRCVADSKDFHGRTPLSYAAEGGISSILRLLLEKGKVDADSKDMEGRTPLSYAALYGDELTIKLLLEIGKVDAGSKDFYGRTILSYAAEGGHISVIKLLLETGKVDADSKDIQGRTPLSFAASYGNESTIKLLLEIGKVDADSKDIGGRTPLSHAAEHSNELAIRLLLKTGEVDVNSKDNSRRTPLSYAALFGSTSIFRHLLEIGKADAYIQDNTFRTPASYAMKRGDPYDKIFSYIETNEETSENIRLQPTA